MRSKKWLLPAVIGGILILPVLWFTLLYLIMPNHAGHFDADDAGGQRRDPVLVG